MAPPAPNTTYATSFGYDALNRPTGVAWDPAPVAATPAAGSVTFSHTYNKANQRIGQSVSDNTWLEYPAATASTVSYTANTLNQYTAVGGVTPTYDGNGNLTGDGTFTFGYDVENRLVSASRLGVTVSYAFDAQGRRKSKTVNGTTTLFVTDADNREVLEYDGASGAPLRWYAYGLGSNDALNQMNLAAATRATFVPDIQGSIIATLDSASGAFTKAGYLPYGTSSSTSGTFRYTGQRIDPETGGLYYYRARAYKPAWGRFMQADPIGYQGGINLYAYVGNDALNLIDPLGLMWDSPKGGDSFGSSGLLGLLQTVGQAEIQRSQLEAQGTQALAGMGLRGLGNALDACAALCDPGFYASVGPALGPAGKAAGGAASELLAGLRGLASLGRGGPAVGPVAGGGATLENLSAGNITRIQNAVDRTGIETTVVGSRASGTAGPTSDWDYILRGGSSSSRSSIRSSLPEGPRGLGEPRNQDFLRVPLDPTKPYITFTPRGQ